jgi:hypothetical protein
MNNINIICSGESILEQFKNINIINYLNNSKNIFVNKSIFF